MDPAILAAAGRLDPTDLKNPLVRRAHPLYTFISLSLLVSLINGRLFTTVGPLTRQETSLSTHSSHCRFWSNVFKSLCDILFHNKHVPVRTAKFATEVLAD
jgi:hypothetical protein